MPAAWPGVVPSPSTCPRLSGVQATGKSDCPNRCCAHPQVTPVELTSRAPLLASTDLGFEFEDESSTAGAVTSSQRAACHPSEKTWNPTTVSVSETAVVPATKPVRTRVRGE